MCLLPWAYLALTIGKRKEEMRRDETRQETKRKEKKMKEKKRKTNTDNILRNKSSLAVA